MTTTQYLIMVLGLAIIIILAILIIRAVRLKSMKNKKNVDKLPKAISDMLFYIHEYIDEAITLIKLLDSHENDTHKGPSLNTFNIKDLADIQGLIQDLMVYYEQGKNRNLSNFNVENTSTEHYEKLLKKWNEFKGISKEDDEGFTEDFRRF